jgi:hypothetical protein
MFIIDAYMNFFHILVNTLEIENTHSIEIQEKSKKNHLQQCKKIITASIFCFYRTTSFYEVTRLELRP